MSKFVADLHLHSSFSRATSRNLNFDTIVSWAKIKGINLISSSDFTHPVWFAETKKNLIEVGNGFYKHISSEKKDSDVNFVLGTEISCIYTQSGKQRRIHCLLYFPRLDDVERFNNKLGRIGNLAADGRPIVGTSAKNLLDIALSVSEDAILIPAHVWTPWFSLYGSNSGFDSIEECFGDLSKYIYAVETGLSSDPAMNWRIADLDGRSIVSFSDAHSAPKMGRELTIFDSEFSFEGLLAALRSNIGEVDQRFLAVPNQPQTSHEIRVRGKRADLPVPRSDSDRGVPMEPQKSGPFHLESVEPRKSDQLAAPSRIAFTIEFFPEEGKYHFTGHRNCSVRHSPEQTAKIGTICPNCKKKLTIGVMHRIDQLAEKDRSEGFIGKARPPFKRLVPLQEIVAEAFGMQVSAKKVQDEYQKLIKELGCELTILLKESLVKIEKATSVYEIAEGIEKVRKGNIVVDPGYDGVYGTVKIWDKEESKKIKTKLVPKQAEGQSSLF